MDYYNGEIIGENNKGEEKVRRLMEEIKKEKIEVDFQNSYMYSDSLSDLPLFKVSRASLFNKFKKEKGKHRGIKMEVGNKYG